MIGIITATTPLFSATAVPEVPNFITLLHAYFHETVWAQSLHKYENIIFSILVAIGLSLLFYFGTKKRDMIPSGLQNFLEWTVDGLRNAIVDILGKDGEKYVPFLGTLFVYILTMNLMGVIPFMKSPSASLNITIGLAVCVFVLVQYLNIKNMGIRGFLYHMAGSPTDKVGWMMAPLMFPLELLTQISRPVTLSLRLFGNILGEDVLMGVGVVFGFAMLAMYDSPIGVPLQIPFMLLAILTSVLQALVFTLLSAVYILLSVPHGHDVHHEKH